MVKDLIAKNVFESIDKLIILKNLRFHFAASVYLKKYYYPKVSM